MQRWNSPWRPVARRHFSRSFSRGPHSRRRTCGAERSCNCPCGIHVNPRHLPPWVEANPNTVLFHFCPCKYTGTSTRPEHGQPNSGPTHVQEHQRQSNMSSLQPQRGRFDALRQHRAPNTLEQKMDVILSLPSQAQAAPAVPPNSRSNSVTASWSHHRQHKAVISLANGYCDSR